MPTAYTSLLGLALPVTGELSGTWGDEVNNYITAYIDAAVAGVQNISGSQTAVTLSTTTNAPLSSAGAGTTGSAQYQIINCTGNPGGALTIDAPKASKAYLVINATSTNQTVTVRGGPTSPTTGVTVAAAQAALIAWNGSDFRRIATTDISQLSGVLGVANGGTGQTTYTNGQLLIGNSSGNTLTKATLTQGTGIAITNGNGSITISATSPGGTVTSVGMTVPTFLSVSPSSITTSGTFAVTLSGTALPVANGGTGLTSGTSGGVLYYSASGTLASSGVLASNAIVLGGGAGATPKTTTTGTGVVTALGNNTNATGGFPTTDGTATLTNKRVNPRVVAAGATSGNLTINGDTTDLYRAEGLTGAITFLQPSGTPVDGQKLMIRLEDNGTGRGITWTTTSGAFRAVGITLPTTTVASKVTYVGCVYNSTDVFWDVVAVVTQA